MANTIEAGNRKHNENSESKMKERASIELNLRHESTGMALGMELGPTRLKLKESLINFIPSIS